MQDVLARRLVAAILLVVCPRLMLFWVVGVAGLDVPPAWLPWIDALMGGATGVVMTGGQMFLAHHLASVSLISSPGGRRRVVALLAALWLVAVAAAVVIGSAHVAMQTSGRKLLEVLQTEWIRTNPLVWVVALVAVGSLELMATGIAVAVADAGARAHHVHVQELEDEAESALRARNAQVDENKRLVHRLHAVEEQLHQAREESARAVHSTVHPSADGSTPARGSAGAPAPASAGSELVKVPCRHACGWISRLMPEPSARKAERAHASRFCSARAGA